MFVLHETCLEYFRRRLAEGWECVSLEGHNAVLLSPEGIRRELDLRNDIETLRPSANGHSILLGKFPDTGEDNYEDVNEAVADEDATYVYSIWNPPRGDYYAIPNSTLTLATINKVTVYGRCRCLAGTPHVGFGLYIGDTIYARPAQGVSNTSYANFTEEWAVDPSDSNPWTVAKVNAIQEIYVGMGAAAAPNNIYCTQVYVEVDYTLPLPTTNAAAGITPTSAILNGALEEDLGEVWDVRFQWGKTEDYGNDTDWQAGFSEGDTFSQLINTLEPGTLYHFRAQAETLAFGTISGRDVAFWTLKPSLGKAYAFSRKLHIKKPTNVLDEASIAASAITTLADCKGLNLREVPSSLTLTVEATYAAAATQGIKIHVRTSLTDHALGTHTGADGAAALTDAEAHFVDDELIGLMIKNLTDGSSGVITANTGTGVTAVLVGGTNNDWDSGDAYIIEGAGYDTEDWDSFTPAFGAGSSIRQTEHYDVDPVYLKAFVENLDGAEEVTDVKIIMAVGT